MTKIEIQQLNLMILKGRIEEASDEGHAELFNEIENLTRIPDESDLNSDELIMFADVYEGYPISLIIAIFKLGFSRGYLNGHDEGYSDAYIDMREDELLK